MTEQGINAGTIEQVVCVNHTNRPTSLRCSRCSDPICPSCAVLTETGYRCRKCLKSQQKIFTTARSIDYPLAFGIAAIIAAIGAYIASFFGFFAILIGPVAGVAVSEAVRLVTGRRRAKLLFQLTTAGVIAGALAVLFYFGSFNLFRLLFQGIFIFLAASTAYYRLSGIRMGR